MKSLDLEVCSSGFVFKDIFILLLPCFHVFSALWWASCYCRPKYVCDTCLTAVCRISASITPFCYTASTSSAFSLFPNLFRYPTPPSRHTNLIRVLPGGGGRCVNHPSCSAECGTLTPLSSLWPKPRRKNLFSHRCHAQMQIHHFLCTLTWKVISLI